MDWDSLVATTVDANCAGLECLSGIPGTVGGTPVQNVGAYGQEVSETIREVRALDLRSMETRTLSNAECGFAYRSSIFNTTERGRYIILEVSFALREGARPSIRYADLQKFFAGQAGEPSLAEVRAAVREIRHRKAMLIVPGDDDARSAGSFFKNPVVPQAFFEELANALEIARVATSQLSRRRRLPQVAGGVAGGARRIREGLCQGRGRHLAQACAGDHQSRRRHCSGNHCIER